MLLPLKSSINLIQMSSSLDTCLIKCPHLASDIEARRGVRRSKEDPSKLEYIFGYDKVTLTLINPLLGIELSSDSVTKEGNIYEGNFFIQLRECPLNRFPRECPHRENKHDFSTKISVKAHPRLILRWHRASSVYKKIKNYRRSFERSNSTCKENDLDILERPRVRGIKRVESLPFSFPYVKPFSF